VAVASLSASDALCRKVIGVATVGLPNGAVMEVVASL
jgi:hypothetical protein